MSVTTCPTCGGLVTIDGTPGRSDIRATYTYTPPALTAAERQVTSNIDDPLPTIEDHFREWLKSQGTDAILNNRKAGPVWGELFEAGFMVGALVTSKLTAHEVLAKAELEADEWICLTREDVAVQSTKTTCPVCGAPVDTRIGHTKGDEGRQLYTYAPPALTAAERAVVESAVRQRYADMAVGSFEKDRKRLREIVAEQSLAHSLYERAVDALLAAQTGTAPDGLAADHRGDVRYLHDPSLPPRVIVDPPQTMSEFRLWKKAQTRSGAMSWSFSIPITPAEEFETTARKVYEFQKPGIEQNNRDGLPASAAALDAAIELVKSGVVGTGNVAASLSGHGNPDHLAPPGWSKDTVTITVYRTDA